MAVDTAEKNVANQKKLNEKQAEREKNRKGSTRGSEFQPEFFFTHAFSALVLYNKLAPA